MLETDYRHLDIVQQRLIDEAEEAMETAYNPYSGFYVGAAVLAQNKEIITGSNFEVAAYGGTVCAERSAILKANAMGIRMFDKVAIIARGHDFETTVVTAPCGSCRQMLYESKQLSGKDLEIIMSTTKKDKIIIATIDELLPLAFGPADIGIDVKQYQTIP